jgi:hypothetical protein
LPSVEKQHLFLLHQCIRDEVQITPITLRAALRELARARGIIRIEVEPEWVITILQGKFGAVFQEVIENYYLEGGPKFDEYIQALEHLTLYAIFRGKEPVLSEELVSALLTAFQKGNRLDRIRAALACMNLAYSYNSEIHQNLSGVQLSTRFQLLSDELITMLDMKDMPSSLVASWALAWMGEHRLLPNLPKTEMLLNLYNIWRNLQNGEQARYLAWAFSAQRLLPRDTFNKNVWGDCDKFLRAAFTEGDYGKTANRLCALAVGWYRQSPWSDAELADIINKFESDYLRSDPTVIELLSNLGDKGKHIIAEWERKNTAFKIRLRKHKKQ